ncbi:translation initiation factor IF-2 [Mycobacterium sp. 1482292.6]|uniref:translation initiation factor IF-2 n=1 Tax=Mycobacterium sp. 1482292.6 TaxID=1834081 RepID=UPI000AEB8EE0
MRVHELAKRLGWTSTRAIETLRERGEYVQSAGSKIEAPVVRDMLRDFAADVSTPSEQLSDVAIDPGLYGRSAAVSAGSDADGLSFAADLARVKAQLPQKKSDGKPTAWMSPVLRVLLYEAVIPCRPDRLGEPEGDFYAWEMKKAKQKHQQWAAAQLNGLHGNDETIIRWIRLTHDGTKAQLAADLSRLGITVDEAGLRVTHGRPDARRDTIFQRYCDGHLSSSEALAEVQQWRRNHAAG